MRALIVVALSLLAIGCNNTRTINTLTSSAGNSGQSAYREAASTAAPTPADDGKEIFAANCLGCHGRNADGNTPAGRNWRVPDLRSPQVQSLDDQRLQQIIRDGKGKMPGWGGLLSQTDIEHLVAYVRSLKGK